MHHTIPIEWDIRQTNIKKNIYKRIEWVKTLCRKWNVYCVFRRFIFLGSNIFAWKGTEEVPRIEINLAKILNCASTAKRNKLTIWWNEILRVLLGKESGFTRSIRFSWIFSSSSLRLLVFGLQINFICISWAVKTLKRSQAAHSRSEARQVWPHPLFVDHCQYRIRDYTIDSVWSRVSLVLAECCWTLEEQNNWETTNSDIKTPRKWKWYVFDCYPHSMYRIILSCF